MLLRCSLLKSKKYFSFFLIKLFFIAYRYLKIERNYVFCADCYIYRKFSFILVEFYLFVYKLHAKNLYFQSKVYLKKSY